MGLPKAVLNEDEYLAFERAALDRHQYVDGEIFAMAGAPKEHHDISSNALVSLANQLGDGPCRAWTQNVRIRSGPLPKSPRRPAGLYSYPDIVVVCDEPKFLDEHNDVLLNPLALIEVLSESTEAFDRTLKLARYQKYNPSLKDYILISQDQPLVEHFHREDDGSWKYTIHEGLKAVVKIEAIKCKLKAADVYKRVEFDAEGMNSVNRNELANHLGKRFLRDVIELTGELDVGSTGQWRGTVVGRPIWAVSNCDVPIDAEIASVQMIGT